MKMLTTEQLKAMRDHFDFKEDPQDLLDVINGHIDANLVVDQLNAQANLYIGTIESLRERLRAIKHEAELSEGIGEER